MGKGNSGSRFASEMERVEEKGVQPVAPALPALERGLTQLLSGEELARIVAASQKHQKSSLL